MTRTGRGSIMSESLRRSPHCRRLALGGLRLIEASRQATDLLLEGTDVPGIDGWHGGRDQTIQFIDWNNVENNDFLVINQFRVDEPGGQSKEFIPPDLVLFVNGIPLAVVECKAPGPEDAMATAIDQLHRYSNQRDDVEANEGNEALFWTNQCVVGTTFEEARVGTFTSGPEHFLEWRDPAPVSREVVAAELGKEVEQLSSQELLIAGIFRPSHLLDIVRHFVLFMRVGQRTVKAVTRYQQFRGVHKAVMRLKTGETRAEDGEVDQRGGVIWHTQGSGKSLTMVFLVRKMRSDPVLRPFKVVIVTDRINLENQLSETARLSGESVYVAGKAQIPGGRKVRLKEMLSERGPSIGMALIQKYRDNQTSESFEDSHAVAGFGVLNQDESIVVFVDEAHRSHVSALHANLMAALPNAARIGFTGTPIKMGAKKRTTEIFGRFIDTYTIKESEEDGSTVPIFYEGKTADGEVRGASSMDELFFRWFSGLTEQQREALQRKYARPAEVLEAPEMIGAKAADMLTHFVSTILPQRFKGMVAASSRLGCVRYRQAFLEAREQLLIGLENLDPALSQLSSSEIDELPSRERFLVRAVELKELIRIIDFVPVFSHEHNDSADWATWTDKHKQETRIDAFAKKSLGAEGEKTSPIAILIVKSMLLTGFDAPEAQALYLDRSIREAELLQAIARVNRTAEHKDYGLIVDYFGVTHHLSEALAAYSNADGELDELVADSLQSIAEEAAHLSERAERLRQFFLTQGVVLAEGPETIEKCVEVLEDPQRRARFDIDLKRFLVSLDIVLPRPDALPYVALAKLLGQIQLSVRRRYRDQGNGGFNPSLYREKVRQLIDEHITVLDLSQAIPPVRITDAGFSDHVSAQSSDRARASEMEHALRHHIREKSGEDPARYKKLSERLDEILEALEGKWKQLAIALEELVVEATSSRKLQESGLDEIDYRFFGLLEDELGYETAGDERELLVAATSEVVGVIKRRASMVGFWLNATTQDALRKEIVNFLDERSLFPLDQCKRAADRLMELSKANQDLLGSV